MAQNAKIRAVQLSRAKKVLQDLPEKEDGKTRPEAAGFLEKDFRKALRKGYTPKELSLILKNEGIIIPAYLIQRFLSETGDTLCPQQRENVPPKTEVPEITFLVVPDMPDEDL